MEANTLQVETVLLRMYSEEKWVYTVCRRQLCLIHSDHEMWITENSSFTVDSSAAPSIATIVVQRGIVGHIQCENVVHCFATWQQLRFVTAVEERKKIELHFCHSSCNHTFDHSVGCDGRVALFVLSLTDPTGRRGSKSMTFLKYFYTKWAWAVGKWDKGLCQSSLAIFNVHVQFQIDWTTAPGEKKWMQADGLPVFYIL